MITSTVLYIVYAFIFGISYPLRLLPDVSLPSALSSAITTANGYISALNVILPMDTILAVLSTVFALELSVFTYKIIMWVVHRLPTQSGSSPS